MNTVSYTELLHVHFGLEDRDQKKFHLISRYFDKVSDRLKKERGYLLNKAKTSAGNELRELVYKENPFLKLILKEPEAGKYFPVPIVFKNQ